MKKGLNTIIQIIIYVLILAFIAGIISFVYRFTNGGTTDLVTFYVEYNGTDILTDTEVGLKNGKAAIFKPKYLIDGVKDMFGNLLKKENKDEKKYSVAIKPNITAETKFTYTVNDNSYKFEKLQDKDFCGEFGYERAASSFMLKIDNFSVADIIASKHDGKEVTLPDNFDDTKIYFNLIITSSDEKSNIVIGLKEDTSITFTIDGKDYTAERNMTLNEWAQSSACRLDIENAEISIEGRKYYLYTDIHDGERLLGESVLIDGKDYYAVSALCSFFIEERQYFCPQNLTWQEWFHSPYGIEYYSVSSTGAVSLKKQTGNLVKELLLSGKPVYITDFIDCNDGVNYSFKPADPVTFFIDGKSYIAENGMTIYSWSKSDLCPIKVSDGQLFVNGRKYLIYDKQQDGIALSGSTILSDDTEYFATTALCSFTIDGTKFYALQHVMWSDWLSENNIDGCFNISDSGIVCYKKNSESVFKALTLNGNYVYAVDIVDIRSAVYGLSEVTE